jgi:phosphatidylglycerol:prolipoprotein diacylglycerol transferase
MWIDNLNPVIVSLGPVEIRWYGLMYVIGFLFVWWFTDRAARKGRLALTPAQVENAMVWLAVGTVVGGRLGYVLFYAPLYFLQHPLEILMFWQGGMSIHGGIIGVCLALWLSLRKSSVRFLQIADVAIIPIALGQTLGRIGNFINGELWGRVTNVPWAMGFPLSGDSMPRHPSQLYEAGYDIIIGTILLLVAWRLRKAGKTKEGLILGLWFVLYAIARFIVEYFRDPSYYVGPLTAGQLLSLPMLVVGVALMWWAFRKKPEQPQHGEHERAHHSPTSSS